MMPPQINEGIGITSPMPSCSKWPGRSGSARPVDANKTSVCVYVRARETHATDHQEALRVGPQHHGRVQRGAVDQRAVKVEDEERVPFLGLGK